MSSIRCKNVEQLFGKSTKSLVWQYNNIQLVKMLLNM